MRQLKLLARSFLILSITDFALAAPVAVRARPEVRLDADVTRNVGAMSKRMYSFDEGELPLPIVPGSDHWNSPPPSPHLTDVLAEIASTNRPPTPDSPEPFTGYLSPNPDHTPPQSPVPAEVLSQVAHTNKPPTLDSPESFPPGYPPPNLDHAPPQSPDFTEISASDYMWPPVPSPSRTPPTQIWSQLAEHVKQLDIPPSAQKNTLEVGPLWPPSLPSPPLPHPSQPGPSEAHFRSPPLAGLSTINQPTPPQNPGVERKIHTVFDPDFSTRFWKEFMNDMRKIRPPMSRSDAVNLAQGEPRF